MVLSGAGILLCSLSPGSGPIILLILQKVFRWHFTHTKHAVVQFQAFQKFLSVPLDLLDLQHTSDLIIKKVFLIG